MSGALVAAVPLPAQARTDVESRKGSSHFPASVEVTTPAGGQATITSPTLDKTTETLKVTVQVDKQAQAAEKRDFLRYAIYLAGKKTPGQRLLACIALHQEDLSTWNSHTQSVEFDVENADRAFMLLLGCMRIAQLIAEIEAEAAARYGAREVAADRAKPQRCAKGPRAFPAKESKVSGKYRLEVDGTGRKAKKGGGLKVTCKAYGNKVVYSVRAKKKGKSLRSVVGKQLRFGMQSPLDAEGSSVTTKVTFRKPKN